jgi:hypothetical protein
VDAREEGFVEGLYAVGGEEENASVVFDVSEAGDLQLSLFRFTR